MAHGRAMLHLVPREGADVAAAVAALDTPATRLVRAADCFIGGASPFAAALEVRGSFEPLIAAAEALDGTFDPGASTALAGDEIDFIAPIAPTPVRFQYLMHRRGDFTHVDYLRRYHDVHREFGLRTPHIEGYTQLHVDLTSSADLAAATGVHGSTPDSMSELHLRSVAHFIEGIAGDPDLSRAAQEDEERFVDRARSFGFTHRVLGD